MTGLALEGGELGLEGPHLLRREESRLVVDPGRERTDLEQRPTRRRDEQDQREQSQRGPSSAGGDANQNWTCGGLSPTSARASKVGFGAAPITFAVSTAGNERTSVL